MIQTRLRQRSPHALAPSSAAAALSHPPLQDGIVLPYIPPKLQNRSFRIAKRTFDILFSALGLLVLSPFFLLMAVAIKLDSKGSVFFRQSRVGLSGRTFNCYKFRSMRTDAEKLQDELAHLNERNGPVFKITHDPRVTRLGIFIRKYSLDEFPQLYCVLRGDMSLVGPRPPLPKEVAVYEPHHLRRLEVKPGLTGLWQVSGRDLSDFEQWVRLDVHYIDTLSLWNELVILARTPLAVLSGKGAC